MSNNIVDKNVSDKVVWENGVTNDNDFTPTMSQPQSEFHSQSQKMFCYNCNNVIPADSKCCPYCQIELYVTCPKCGAKYSSQYPACNQCGTNRLEYIEMQKREKERIEARKRDERLQREKLEREKLEKERQEILAKAREMAHITQQKDAYIAENKEIMKTSEYKSAYALITESFDIFDKICTRRFIITSILYIIGFILGICSAEYDIMESVGIAYALLGLPICVAFLKYKGSDSQRKKFISEYVSNNKGYDKSLFTTDLIAMVNYQGKDRLSDCCIIAYRKKHGLNINYKWHSMR